jgi:prepilin-type N-terminal cleavage/methylation domain-containing protein
MKLTSARQGGRQGFTLVELLIVIAIIGLLVSLISAAVYKALGVSTRVRNQQEISQLAVAVESFKQKFGIYPPSRIILCEQLALYYANNNPGSNQYKSQLHQDSLNFLQQIWPRLNWNYQNKPGLGSRWTGIDWNGDGQFTPGEFLLEGDQCLVFFLGGIPGKGPSGPFCTGFSTNPENPAYHTVATGTEVVPPFFEFQSSRLVVLPNKARSPSHYSYKDTYGMTPYAYFSSYKTRNGYNRFALIGGKPSSDCATLGVWPYAEALSPSPRYQNPNTFQIISAGPDGQFGKGSDPTIATALWSPAIAGSTPATAGPTPATATAGADDQSNFYDSPLGTPSTPGT